MIKLNKQFLNIVDSGSNENGSWEKYSDGTMKCWAVIDAYLTGGHTKSVNGLYASEMKTITFPQGFEGRPQIFPYIRRSVDDQTSAIPFIGYSTGSYFKFWSGMLISTTSTGFERGYLAIGKWK